MRVSVGHEGQDFLHRCRKWIGEGERSASSSPVRHPGMRIWSCSCDRDLSGVSLTSGKACGQDRHGGSGFTSSGPGDDTFTGTAQNTFARSSSEAWLKSWCIGRMVGRKETKTRSMGPANLHRDSIREIASGGFRIGLARKCSRGEVSEVWPECLSCLCNGLVRYERAACPDAAIILRPWVHPFRTVLCQLLIVAPQVGMVVELGQRYAALRSCVSTAWAMRVSKTRRTLWFSQRVMRLKPAELVFVHANPPAARKSGKNSEAREGNASEGIFSSAGETVP